jgi:hypothetical protein
MGFLNPREKGRAFKMRMLRIFGPKMQEITGWRKLHDELHNLYPTPNIR